MISKIQLKKLLSQDKIRTVLEHLNEIQMPNRDLKNLIIVMTGQLSHLEKEHRSGVLDYEDYNIRMNRIRHSVLSIIEELDEFPETDRWKLTENQKRAAKGIGTVGIIALIANLSQISGCNLKEMLGCNRPIPASNSSVTVFVHGKNGKHDLVLRQRGYLLLDVPNENRKKELIDDKGAATFKNVKVGDKVTMNVDLEEPYRAVKSDSVYTIPANGSLYLEVALQNQEKIYGQVTYKEMPLADVQVSIDTLKVKTDAIGNYRLFVPIHLRLEKHDILFLKEGFKMGRKPIGQQANTPIDMVMEKK